MQCALHGVGCDGKCSFIRPVEADLWDHEKGQGGEEDQQAQQEAQREGQVAPATQPHALLQVLSDPHNVLLGETVL